MSILYGIGMGRFNFQRRTFTVPIKELPAAFDGYKIVLISDFHLGNFSRSQKRVKPLFDRISRENADLVVFTGDMVNNFATETAGWKSYIKELKNKDGMFAVLGNHDYGAYYQWSDSISEQANQRAVADSIRNFGFNLLINQSAIIEKGDDRIAIVGIENWGTAKHLPKLADLRTAMEPVADVPVKILLSHNPDYWQDSVVGKQPVILTLSGHTHGAQIGFEWGRFKFSPAQFFYQHWDGLYDENGQYLIVTRGVGTAGIPARYSMSPEYIVITLKKE
jgi:predicted MPP superfamily phosphohydrolase